MSNNPFSHIYLSAKNAAVRRFMQTQLKTQPPKIPEINTRLWLNRVNLSPPWVVWDECQITLFLNIHRQTTCCLSSMCKANEAERTRDIPGSKNENMWTSLASRSLRRRPAVFFFFISSIYFFLSPRETFRCRINCFQIIAPDRSSWNSSSRVEDLPNNNNEKFRCKIFDFLP